MSQAPLEGRAFVCRAGKIALFEDPSEAASVVELQSAEPSVEQEPVWFFPVPTVAVDEPVGAQGVVSFAQYPVEDEV